MVLNVVDLSNHQGKVSTNLGNYPADAYMFKATEGINYTDPYCDPFVQNAIKAGKPFGVYHFMDGSNWKAQADYFIKAIKGYIGKAILCLDYEMYGRQGSGVAKQWLDYVKQQTGVKPIIYMNSSDSQSDDWSQVVAADYGLWIAAYQSSFPKIGYWKSAMMWQYTSTPYDKNYFYGSVDNWKAYTLKEGTKPQPAKDPLRAGEHNPIKSNKWAQGHLDRFGEIANNKLWAYGWIYDNQGFDYGFAFIREAGTNKELARSMSKGVVRIDVNDHLNINTKLKYGIDVTFDISKFKGKKVYVMFRRTNDPTGNEKGGSVDVNFEEWSITL